MLEHFKGGHGCQISDIIIKPIELCDIKELDKRETYWIKELNTIFPYGLNMDGKSKGLKDAYQIVAANSSKICIYEYFNKVVSSKRTKKGSGKKRQENPYVAPNIEDWINYHASIDSGKFIYLVRKSLFQLKLEDIKKMYIFSVNSINKNIISKPSHKHFMYIIKDMCLRQIRSSVPTKTFNNDNFLTIKFVNKLIENIKLNQLLKKNEIRNSFPIKNCSMATPTISYSRDKSIGTKVLNYNSVIKDSMSQTYICKCNEYPERYRDSHHNHIVTGDLDVVSHVELRELLKKGHNYHEQQPPNVNAAYSSVKNGIDRYISLASHKLSIPIVQFSKWKSKLLYEIKKNLDNCNTYKFNNVLSKSGPKEALQKLKNDFAIVPVDKAASNVSFVCKAYYMEVINHEIMESGTFARTNLSTLQVISNISQSSYIKSNDPRSLPTLYATTKMHKTPPSFRFITAGRETIIQNLSQNVGKCLNKLIGVSKTYSQYKIKEIDNCVFIIDNRDAVIKFLCTENNQNPGRKSVSTWDFSTLYTKIPHSQLKDNVKYFVEKIFKFLDKEYINSSFSSKKAYFSKNRSKKNVSFNVHELIEAIYFIIDNSYITFQSYIYRQTIGIPMGTNCAPHLANIYLHVYEYKYLGKLIREGKHEEAKKLSNVYRYQDDCVAIDDDNMFFIHAPKIYPKEMILKNTNITTNKSTFLDLTISIYRQKFLYYSWDKRRDFQFHVVSYPNLSGNIPSSQSYGVFTSQLTRFCDINMTYSHFLKDIKLLSKKFLSQGFMMYKLKDKLVQFRNNYFFKWAKYNVDISGCINKLFGTHSVW